jgi:hypothetical protein
MSRPDPHRRRRPTGAAWLAFVAVLLVSACGPATPSSAPPSAASPSSPAATSQPSASAAEPSGSAAAPSASTDAATDAIYDAVETQVVAIRGLKPLRPVERQFISEAELRSRITQLFDEETPPAYLAANDRLYKALGLIPATSNLRDLSLELLSAAVGGFYRSEEGKLYVVSKTGTPGPNERFYFAHEYDHALQDQNSTIFKDQDGVLDQGDRILARQATYEGDATLLMSQWAAANLTQAELLEVFSSGSDPEAVAVLARTPAILRDTLLFPYNVGLGYIQAVQTAGGWPAVNAYFKAMPESTEQILHPEKYTAHERPAAVTLPADLATRLGAGWTVPLQDTFGEYQLGIWLRENKIASEAATKAAAGWGGDRLAVMEGPDGAWGVVLETTWDKETEATEFEDAAQTVVDALPHKGHVSAPTPKRVTILIASDDETLQALDVIFGATGV